MTRSELQARIDQLKQEIQKEEQIKRGAESMQAAWMGAKGSSDAYLKSKENVDVCVKIIKEKSAELERLTLLLQAAEVRRFSRGQYERRSSGQTILTPTVFFFFLT